MGLLVGGRAPDPGDGEEPAGERRRRPRARVLLALLGAALATGAAVAVPALLSDGDDPGGDVLRPADGWSGVTVCRTQPESGCVERGPAQAERLADALLPLQPVAPDLITCLAIGERYLVRLRGDRAVPELTVDTVCGPVLAADGRYEVDEEGRAAVAEVWAGG